MDFPRRVRLEPDVAEKLLIHRVEPAYPDTIRRAAIRGQVELSVVVDADGKVESANASSGHPTLKQLATDAVMQWRYKPHVVEGEATGFHTQVRLQFPPPVPQYESKVIK